MGILSDAPQGFSSAVSALNQVPQGILAEMCQDVVAYLQYQPGFINAGDYEATLSKVNVEPKPSARACINALSFIFRAAAREKLTVDALVAELKASLEWSEGTVAVIRHVWKEGGPELCGLDRQPLSIGQLVSMKWQLGVAMSSDACRTLNSPQVTLQFRVAGTEGVSTVHTVEMTISEFQNFSTQLKEMASTLDAVA